MDLINFNLRVGIVAIVQLYFIQKLSDYLQTLFL